MIKYAYSEMFREFMRNTSAEARSILAETWHGLGSTALDAFAHELVAFDADMTPGNGRYYSAQMSAFMDNVEPTASTPLLLDRLAAHASARGAPGDNLHAESIDAFAWEWRIVHGIATASHAEVEVNLPRIDDPWHFE